MYAVIAAAVLIFVMGTGICWADDCSVGRTADGIYPVNEADVTMLSEDIHIGVETGLVDCNFVFQNNSDANKDILMGFPAKTKEYEEGPATGDPEVHNFKAYVNGIEVPAKLEKETFPEQGGNTSVGSYDNWYVFDVSFPAGSTLNIRNTYSVSNTVYSTGEVSLGYVLKTGAVWEGKIAHARVVFDLENIKPYELTTIFPAAMLIKNNQN